MYLPGSDTVIGRSLKLYGEWAEPEIDMLAQHVSGTRAIVDVGANIGTHSGAFSRRFPGATIVAIEPQPLAHALLTANVVTNDWRNVQTVHAALGERHRILNLGMDYSHVENFGAVTVDESTQVEPGGFPVVMTTLDRLAARLDVELVKIDVEGMEGAVLRGALDTLERCLDYALRWAPTQAFNPSNHNAVRTSIWGLGELGVLAIPMERCDSSFGEPISTLNEELPPRPITVTV
jgi:FkbM family methyltransferase